MNTKRALQYENRCNFDDGNYEQFKKFSACTCWRSGLYPKCWWRNRMLLVNKSFSRNVSTMTSQHSKPHSCLMAGSFEGDRVLAAWGCIKELCSTTTSNFGKYKGQNTGSCREPLLWNARKSLGNIVPGRAERQVAWVKNSTGIH